mmetsp:Transcript_59542/g.172449  ORF Transcript_59542/g.172449 Transcript_59542/m.172449 type:complete len:204 (+) Transcript_59542:1732-2343(+)
MWLSATPRVSGASGTSKTSWFSSSIGACMTTCAPPAAAPAAGCADSGSSGSTTAKFSNVCEKFRRMGSRVSRLSVMASISAWKIRHPDIVLFRVPSSLMSPAGSGTFSPSPELVVVVVALLSQAADTVKTEPAASTDRFPVKLSHFAPAALLPDQMAYLNSTFCPNGNVTLSDCQTGNVAAFVARGTALAVSHAPKASWLPTT